MPRLTQLFNRAEPTVEEIHILRGIAKAMQQAAAAGGEAPAREPAPRRARLTASAGAAGRRGAARPPGFGRRPLRCSLPVFPAIFGRMSAHEQSLSAISERVDRLLDLCRTLQEENRSLRNSQEQLANERAQLLARNEQARSRVEAMIARLKSLEQNQA